MQSILGYWPQACNTKLSTIGQSWGPHTLLNLADFSFESKEMSLCIRLHDAGPNSYSSAVHIGVSSFR